MKVQIKTKKYTRKPTKKGCAYVLQQNFGRFFERFYLSAIDPRGIDGQLDALEPAAAATTDVEVHDRERNVELGCGRIAGLCYKAIEFGDKRGTDNMDTRKGSQHRGLLPFHLARIDIGPASQTVTLIEEQISARVALVDDEGCIVLVLLVDAAYIHLTHNIHIMNQYRSIIFEKMQGLTQSSSSIEKAAPLIAHTNVDSEMLVGIEETDDLITEMMDIDNNVIETGFTQLQDIIFEEGFAGNFDQCLRAVEGQWLEPGAESGGENHCIHSMKDYGYGEQK